MKLSKGKFEAELNEVEKFLRHVDFFEDRNIYPNDDFDPATYRSKNYFENWQSLIRENIYNFLFSDNSVLVFNYTKTSFTYLECPLMCLTYKEYLDENNLEEEDGDDKTFQDYYNLYLDSCPLKESPLTIRYDLDEPSYFSGLHPASHFHIGHKNQIRIGTDKILGPITFVNFIIRQQYPAIWKFLISKDNNGAKAEEWKKSYLKHKDKLGKTESKFWNEYDLAEMFLI